jgi:hypothetical protein
MSVIYVEFVRSDTVSSLKHFYYLLL